MNAGLTLVPVVLGDLNGNDQLDTDDIDMFEMSLTLGFDESAIRILAARPPFAAFDVNNDQLVDFGDVEYWVKNIKHTWMGDANLDGQFDTDDLIAVFQEGHYEDPLVTNSSWHAGDWNLDHRFTTSDLILAFQDGGYGVGPRATTVPVPEASSHILYLLGVCGLGYVRTTRRHH